MRFFLFDCPYKRKSELGEKGFYILRLWPLFVWESRCDAQNFEIVQNLVKLYNAFSKFRFPLIVKLLTEDPTYHESFILTNLLVNLFDCLVKLYTWKNCWCQNPHHQDVVFHVFSFLKPTDNLLGSKFGDIFLIVNFHQLIREQSPRSCSLFALIVNITFLVLPFLFFFLILLFYIPNGNKELSNIFVKLFIRNQIHEFFRWFLKWKIPKNNAPSINAIMRIHVNICLFYVCNIEKVNHVKQ